MGAGSRKAARSSTARIMGLDRMRFTVISWASRHVRGVALVLFGDWFFNGRYEPAPRWGVTRRGARGGIFRGRPGARRGGGAAPGLDGAARVGQRVPG